MAANEDGESLGRTLLRGAMWGVGFTIVAVPLGMLIRHALEDEDQQEAALERALATHELKRRDGWFEHEDEED